MPATTQAFLDMKEENVRNHLQEHVQHLRKKGLTARRKLHAATRLGDPKAAEKYGFNHPITHRRKGMGAFWARSVAPNGGTKNEDTPILIPLSENGIGRFNGQPREHQKIRAKNTIR